MADLEKDVIAGIGDKEAEENVIYPYFDATVRKFINGISESIIDGLVLSRDGLTLTAGLCLAEGFIGELKDDITFDTAPNKIYGQFVINHTKGVVDRFYIKADPVESLIKRDDILHYKGEYWILLYENKELQCNDDYPAHAVLADNATYLMPYSNTMPTIGANVEVEGDTKSGDTSDKTVASTAWVQKVVQEQIGYETQTIDYGFNNVHSGSTKCGEATIIKKANIAIMEINITNSVDLSLGYADMTKVNFSNIINEKFRPNEDILIFVPVKYWTTYSSQTITKLIPFNIKTDGSISSLITALSDEGEKTYKREKMTSGWKINI